MKKGFTLVELLAVIVILGLLAILIVPKINNALKESEKKTNMASANGLIKSVEYKYQDNEIKGISENITIDFTTGKNIEKIEYNGTKPTSGQISIRKNGVIIMAVRIGDNCYIKKNDTNEITVIPYDKEKCGETSEAMINYEIPNITQSSDGLYESKVDNAKLIFRGANPNNYISLKENNTEVVYRIVSYEGDGTIKVVRNESIGNKPWDERTTTSTGPRYNSSNTYCQSLAGGQYLGCNVWGSQDTTYYNNTKLVGNFLYKYYPERNSSNFHNGSFIGTVTQESSLNTYLNTTFINTLGFKEYIADHTFDAGGIYYHTKYVGGDKEITKEKEEQQVYKWKGRIGVLNVTELVELSTNSACTSVYSNYRWNPRNYDSNTGTLNYGTGEWPCAINNWMFKNNTQWTITPNSSGKQDVYYMSANGDFSSSTAYSGLEVYPALYLKGSTKLTGLGTIENPYRIVES